MTSSGDADKHDHDHDHAHDHHGHMHGHGGGHAPASFGMAFAVGTALNTGFVVAQVCFGFAAHSVTLLADAVHNLGDVLGLLIAWGAATLAQRLPTAARTYGWGRSTILASLANAVVLLFGCGAIAVEAVRRFGDPAPVGGSTVMWVAAAGIVINGATALLFMRGRNDDLNIRGAFLHMAADAGVSAGVVIAGLLMTLTGWHWLDPVTSLLIVVVITIGTWNLLRDSANLALDAVPGGIDLGKVDVALRGLPGVIDVHDLHVWGLSTTDTALTAHLVHDGGNPGALILAACREMRDDFSIGHSTFQIETPELAEACALRPAHVI
ncbi:MAG: cobalt-zinc-cadmium efflux system protein [Acetobacteraceae bacterium]|nr:cobalt-zinc-cadmium efflux system protein [Acetobacteraceae bacterium]